MSRPTPEHVTLSAIVPRGFQGYWSIIRRLDILGPWTVNDVAGCTNVRRADVQDYIRRLTAAGFSRVVEQIACRRGPFSQKRYRLVSRPVEAPRIRKDGTLRSPTGQEQMWRALRQLGTTSATELAMAASTDEVRVSEIAARTYIGLLTKAGYLQVIEVGTAQTGVNRVRLKPAMNTGPLAPMVMRTKILWDPNKSKPMGVAELEEVSP